MSKRLAYLEKVTSEGTKDPFPWYGLAIEYGNLGRLEDAIATFGKLRDLDPGYVPMYLMCGNLLVKAGRVDEGRSWFTEGVVAAKKKGDGHALSELEDALAASNSGI